jgi:hypothetical protein
VWYRKLAPDSFVFALYITTYQTQACFTHLVTAGLLVNKDACHLQQHLLVAMTQQEKKNMI